MLLPTLSLSMSIPCINGSYISQDPKLHCGYLDMLSVGGYIYLHSHRNECLLASHYARGMMSGERVWDAPIPLQHTSAKLSYRSRTPLGFESATLAYLQLQLVQLQVVLGYFHVTPTWASSPS